MRKAGCLDDAEHITNTDFVSHRLISRALMGNMSVKKLGAERSLKYVDRCPMRKTIGGVAEENLKDPVSRGDRATRLASADALARMAAGALKAANANAGWRPHVRPEVKRESPSGSGSMNDNEGRNRRRQGEGLGSKRPGADVEQTRESVEVTQERKVLGQSMFGPVYEGMTHGAQVKKESPALSAVLSGKPISTAGPEATAIAGQTTAERQAAMVSLGNPQGERGGSRDPKSKAKINSAAKAGPKAPSPDPSVKTSSPDASMKTVSEPSVETIIEGPAYGPHWSDGRLNPPVQDPGSPNTPAYIPPPLRPNPPKPGVSKAAAGQPEEIRINPGKILNGERVPTAKAPKWRNTADDHFVHEPGYRFRYGVERTIPIGTNYTPGDQVQPEHIRPGPLVKGTGKLDNLRVEVNPGGGSKVKKVGGPRDDNHGIQPSKDRSKSTIMERRWREAQAAKAASVTANPEVVRMAQATTAAAAATADVAETIASHQVAPNLAQGKPGDATAVAGKRPGGPSNATVSQPVDAVPINLVNAPQSEAYAPSPMEMVWDFGGLESAGSPGVQPMSTTGSLPSSRVDAEEKGTVRSATISSYSPMVTDSPGGVQSVTRKDTSPLAQVATNSEMVWNFGAAMNDHRPMSVESPGPKYDFNPPANMFTAVGEFSTGLNKILGARGAARAADVYQKLAGQKYIDQANELALTPDGRSKLMLNLLMVNLMQSVVQESLRANDPKKLAENEYFTQVKYDEDFTASAMAAAYMTAAKSVGRTQAQEAALNLARLGLDYDPRTQENMTNAGGGDFRFAKNIVVAMGQHILANNQNENPAVARDRLYLEQLANPVGFDDTMDSIHRDSPMQNPAPHNAYNRDNNPRREPIFENT